MNIFTKAKVVKLLNDKIDSGEIKNYNLTDSYLRISKSKRTGFTLKFNNISQQNLITLLKKKTPKPSIQNITDFYKIEIKKLNESR
jgi:hypothetical protein